MADACHAFAEKLRAGRSLAEECCNEAAEAAAVGWLCSPPCQALSREIIEGLASIFQNGPAEASAADNSELILPLQHEFFIHLSTDDKTSCSLDAGLQLLSVIRSKCFSLLLECSQAKEFLQSAATRFDAYFRDLQQSMTVSSYQRELSIKQKRLREANYFILQEKRRYRTIFNRMSEPAFIVDEGKRITDVNKAFVEFIGAKKEVIVGRGCCNVLGSATCSVCGLDRALREEESFSNLEAEISINGALRTVLFAGTFLGEINGQFAGGIVIIQDITEKKRIERQLLLSEEKYRSLVENVPDVTWRASAEEGLVYISPNIERICGYSQEEIMADGWHGWISCIYEDDRDSVAQAFANLFSKSARRDLSYRFQCKNGSWIWLRDRAGTAYENDGKLFVDGVLSDITRLKLVELGLEQQYLHLAEVVDRRTGELRESNTKLLSEIAERQQAEEELLHTANRLRESNDELEQFAQIASHDMKEPLLLITAFAERLQRNCGDLLDDRGRQYLKRIRKASNRLQELVQALLDLARVTTRARSFEKIGLQDLLQDVVQHLEERVRQSSAEIVFTSSHWLQGDRTQIWQLFQNILSNALKYRQKDLAPRVEIGSRDADNGFCEIFIRDNGIGFSEEDRERIFMPFSRLHQAKGFEGTGMGLATCRKIVARHGGEITAHSKPGEGSVFIVRLPLYRPCQTHDPVPA